MKFQSCIVKGTLIGILSIVSRLYGQGPQEVQFHSSDGLSITADLYHTSKKNPTLILFHQSVSSRGEYREIAPRFQKMGFNCLAVDLRWGKKDFWSKVSNETARRNGTYAIVDNYENTKEYQLNQVWPIIWKAYEDMKASLNYLKGEGYEEEIVVVGSSFSAMLVFKMVADKLPVDGIVAFSPGEYHPEKGDMLSLWANKVTLPVYMSAGSGELEMVEEVREAISPGSKVVIHQSTGRHGASVLMSEEDDWPPLNDFLKQFIREEAIGFRHLSLNRYSKEWSDSRKSINAWFWYPVYNGQSGNYTTREYLKYINPAKSQEENAKTFNRIVQSLTNDSTTHAELDRFLEAIIAVDFEAAEPVEGTPLVVLSGAHPIYFVGLAEKLTQAGFAVLSVSRSGIKQGERLSFTMEGVAEYKQDLTTTLTYLQTEKLVDTSIASYISWSFEGVPTLQLAMEKGARHFISLDSSIGYGYGKDLLEGIINTFEWDFPVIHYTGSSMDYGKDLELLTRFSEEIRIARFFDFSHAQFTSLQSITLPEISESSPIKEYENLVEEIISHLKTVQ